MARVASASLSCRHTAKPSAPGMTTSSRIRSGCACGGDAERLVRVRRGQDFVSARLQHTGQQPDVGGRIVDDQDLFAGHAVPDRRGDHRRPARGSAGWRPCRSWPDSRADVRRDDARRPRRPRAHRGTPSGSVALCRSAAPLMRATRLSGSVMRAEVRRRQRRRGFRADAPGRTRRSTGLPRSCRSVRCGTASPENHRTRPPGSAPVRRASTDADVATMRTCGAPGSFRISRAVSDPVQAGQPHVHEDDVGTQFANRLDRLPAVLCHRAVAAGHAEHRRQHVAILEHVVDDQRADVTSRREPDDLTALGIQFEWRGAGRQVQREVKTRPVAWSSTRRRGCRPSAPRGGGQSPGRARCRPSRCPAGPAETVRRRGR